jgi:hypothetical protein
MGIYRTFYITRMKLEMYEVQPIYKNKFTNFINTMRTKQSRLNKFFKFCFMCGRNIYKFTNFIIRMRMKSVNIK